MGLVPALVSSCHSLGLVSALMCIRTDEKQNFVLKIETTPSPLLLFQGSTSLLPSWLLRLPSLSAAGGWGLWSVCCSHALQLFPLHAFFLLQCGAFHGLQSFGRNLFQHGLHSLEENLCSSTCSTSSSFFFEPCCLRHPKLCIQETLVLVTSGDLELLASKLLFLL